MGQVGDLTLENYKSMLADYEYELAVQRRRGHRIVVDLQSAIAHVMKAIAAFEAAEAEGSATAPLNLG